MKNNDNQQDMGEKWLDLPLERGACADMGIRGREIKGTPGGDEIEKGWNKPCVLYVAMWLVVRRAKVAEEEKGKGEDLWLIIVQKRSVGILMWAV